MGDAISDIGLFNCVAAPPAGNVPESMGTFPITRRAAYFALPRLHVFISGRFARHDEFKGSSDLLAAMTGASPGGEDRGAPFSDAVH